jgi:hypothetical protein
LGDGAAYGSSRLLNPSPNIGLSRLPHAFRRLSLRPTCACTGCLFRSGAPVCVTLALDARTGKTVWVVGGGPNRLQADQSRPCVRLILVTTRLLAHPSFSATRRKLNWSGAAQHGPCARPAGLRPLPPSIPSINQMVIRVNPENENPRCPPAPGVNVTDLWKG